MNFCLVIIIFLILIYLYKNHHPKEYFSSIDVLDVKNNETKIMIKKMLKDMDGVFIINDVTYWLDGDTLLSALKYGDIIADHHASVCILYQDEYKLPLLKNEFAKMGYGLTSFWGGYKLYPLSGLDIKYKDRIWNKYEVNLELEDREFFNYKYPFVDIFVCRKFDDIYHYSNKHLRTMFSMYYHKVNNLFPLKRYWLKDLKLFGPNDPIPYIKRVYDDNLNGYIIYDHVGNRYIPLVKGKIEPTRN